MAEQAWLCNVTNYYLLDRLQLLCETPAFMFNFRLCGAWWTLQLTHITGTGFLKAMILMLKTKA